jgi:single-strand DNA-binding protein
MANFNLNKVILGGRLTADPELKTTPSGVSVTSFTVAVNRRFGGKEGEEAQADFINVTAWRATAEFITKYFRKASSICIVGSIQTKTWIDQNGQKRFATEIVADEAYFVDAKSEMPGQSAPQVYASPSAMPQQNGYMPNDYGVQSPMSAPAPTMEMMGNDDELPF